jgi:hypothetical protein
VRLSAELRDIRFRFHRFIRAIFAKTRFRTTKKRAGSNHCGVRELLEKLLFAARGWSSFGERVAAFSGRASAPATRWPPAKPPILAA